MRDDLVVEEVEDESSEIESLGKRVLVTKHHSSDSQYLYQTNSNPETLLGPRTSKPFLS